MIKNRKLSTHTYYEDTVDEIVSEIVGSYYNVFKSLIEKLSKID